MSGPVLQEWEGYVVSTDGARFKARLVDVTAGDTVEGEEAEIPLASLPEAERPFVREGAFFTWTVSGTDESDARSVIAFSRATWSAEEIDAAKLRGAALAEALARMRDDGETVVGEDGLEPSPQR